MSETYNKIIKDFSQKRKDLTFSPENLDNLTEQERQIIEMYIIKLCQLGNTSSYQYIPYLKTVNLREMFNNRVLKELPEYDRAIIYRKLYEKTKEKIYLNMIEVLAKNNAEIYGILIYIYNKMDENSKDKPGLLKRLKLLVNSLDEKNLKICNDMLKKSLDSHKNIKKIEYEKIKGGLLGFATADALGVPVEFTSRISRKSNPVTDMKGYGTHNVPEGTWSDDTSMTIAFMDSIIENRIINYDDIMNKFIKWYEDAEYTATDEIFDIGITTREALYNYKYKNIPSQKAGLSNERSNGNGSLMRMLPVAQYLYMNNFTDDEETEIINNLSSLTHAHEISKLGCKIFCDYVKELLKGKTKEEAYDNIKKIDYTKLYDEKTIEKYNRILKNDIKSYSETEIFSSGYIVNTLEASLWCTLNSNSYKDSVIKAVNLGNDTDTVGAITGGINGTIYKTKDIPENWLLKLKKKEYLEELALKYSNTIVKDHTNNYQYACLDPETYIITKKENLEEMLKKEDQEEKSNTIIK